MRKREEVSKAVDAVFSGAGADPALYDCVLKAAKEAEAPAKRRKTPTVALVMLFVLLTATVAVAVGYRGVSYFLEERSEEKRILDPGYVIDGVPQQHTSQHLQASVVDAYWDGLTLSVAYRVAPEDPGQVVYVQCTYDGHRHISPSGEADILLYEPDFINITSKADGSIQRPEKVQCDWIYEDDGSISLLVRFPHYDMSEAVGISIPVFNVLTENGQLHRSMLHFDPAILADPIEAHEHLWSKATCISVKTCAFCGRTEKGFAPHDYIPAGDRTGLSCSVCGTGIHWPTYVPAESTLRPGDENVFVLALQLRLNELGFYNGRFTGVYSEETTAAVVAFQEKNGLPADGICRKDSLLLLFSID